MIKRRMLYATLQEGSDNNEIHSGIQPFQLIPMFQATVFASSGRATDCELIIVAVSSALLGSNSYRHPAINIQGKERNGESKCAINMYQDRAGKLGEGKDSWKHQRCFEPVRANLQGYSLQRPETLGNGKMIATNTESSKNIWTSTHQLELDWSNGWIEGKSLYAFMQEIQFQPDLLQPAFLVKEPIISSKWSQWFFFSKGSDGGRSDSCLFFFYNHRG